MAAVLLAVVAGVAEASDGHLEIVSIAYLGLKDLHIWRNDNGKP
jgi:hypothetical protein